MGYYDLETNAPYLHYIVHTNEYIEGEYPDLYYKANHSFQYYCPSGYVSMHYNGVVSRFYKNSSSSNLSFSLNAGQFSVIFGNGTVLIPWNGGVSYSPEVSTSVTAYYSGSGNITLPKLTIPPGTLSANIKSVGEQSCVINIDYTNPYNFWFTRIYNVTDNKWEKSPAIIGDNSITGLVSGKNYSFRIELCGRDGTIGRSTTLTLKTAISPAEVTAYIKSYTHNSCVINISLSNNKNNYWYCKIYDRDSKKYIFEKAIVGDNIIKNLLSGKTYNFAVEMWGKNDTVLTKAIFLSFKTTGVSYVNQCISDYVTDPITLRISSFNDSFKNNLKFTIEGRQFFSASQFQTVGFMKQFNLAWNDNQINMIYDLIKNKPCALCVVQIETFDNDNSIGLSEYEFNIFKPPSKDVVYGVLKNSDDTLLPMPFLPKGIVVEMNTNPSKHFGGQWQEIDNGLWEHVEYEPNPYSRQRLLFNLGKRREIKC